MIIVECRHVLLLTTILAVSSAQDKSSSNSCKASQQARQFNTADLEWAISTGIVEPSLRHLHEESDNFCDEAARLRFRNSDGTCNNPRNLGSSSKPIDRVLPPEFDDGISSPRQRGVDGGALSSARTISLNIHTSQDVFTNNTILLMQYGQWIAHDMVATASVTGASNCCGPNGTCPPFVKDPDCFPMELPANEDTFPGTCLNFVRSMPATDVHGAQLSPRQLINTVTAFHDGSMIYGSTDEVAQLVREPGGYLLRTRNGFLPESTTASCIKEHVDDYCFLAGDSRVNQNPALGVLNTIWVREHNRIARRLKTIHPNIDHEELFQETKRIIVAYHQAITYNNYLPLILGQSAELWRLTSTSGRSTFNPDINPSIFVGFSVSAFRFGHSNIPSRLPLGNVLELLRRLFNRPGPVLRNFDGIVSGITGVANVTEIRMQATDRFFVPDISKFMFLNANTGRGLDLVAIDIQRGRDHGLPPYHKWRSFCGLRQVTGFGDTEALGPNVDRLAQVYRSIEDIDLFTGMLHEPIDTGLVGPTIRCILGIQFFRTKYGDRWFFDNNEQSTRFTNAQLASIRTISLAKVICQNTNLNKIPRDVFRLESSSNPLVNCADLNRSDLKFNIFV